MSKPEIASEPASLLEQVSSFVVFIPLLMKLTVYNNRTLAHRNVSLNTGVSFIFIVINFQGFSENQDLENM